MDAERWARIKLIFYGATECAASERSALVRSQCGGDESLVQEIESLLSAHERGHSFIESTALESESQEFDAESDQDTGKLIGPYRVIRRIGSGGMGFVYLAERADREFEKQVAIKLIRRGLAEDFVVKRFVSERRILARLEHPNIARLIDGGTTEDWLPYLVMEYVEGEPVTEYCADRALSVAERLKLFRQICGAVQHAHQNLIVHRDIKPSNILVTEDGQPKLLDFGIAKLLSPDSESENPTTLLGRAMTPDYASPEQARGDPITTASDVYSLGVLLYELLAGSRPYRITSSSPLEIARIICEEEPPRLSTGVEHARAISCPDRPAAEATMPGGDARTANDTRKLRRQLAGDLDNIVFKAMRKESQHRYSSVQEFSEDIRRHLDGLPVTARRGTFAYRASKFARRHRVSMAAAAAVLITLLGAAVITSRQARAARIARDRAEERSQEIRKISNSLLSNVQESLSSVRGAEPTQRLLAENALAYLDRLARDANDDPALLGELASGYHQVGSLRFIQLNDTLGALPVYEKAVDLYQRRVTLAPRDLAAKQDLDGGLSGVSELLAALARHDELLEVQNQRIALWELLLSAEPTSTERIFTLGTLFFGRGETLAALKRDDQASADFRTALESINQAISQQEQAASQEPEARVDLSGKYMWQGEIWARLGDWRNAVESQRKAGAIAEAVWRENPKLIQSLRNTSRSHRYVAEALERLGDSHGELEHYRHSLGVIADARPKNPDYDLNYGEAYYRVRVGTTLRKLGETETAVKMVSRGVTLLRKPFEDDNRAYTLIAADEVFEVAADFFAGIGDYSQALDIYRMVIKKCESLRKTTPHQADLTGRLAGYYAAVGDIHAGFDPQTKLFTAAKRSVFDEAAGWYQKSLETLEVQSEQLNDPGFGPAFRLDNEKRAEALREKLDQCRRRIESSRQ